MPPPAWRRLRSNFPFALLLFAFSLSVSLPGQTAAQSPPASSISDVVIEGLGNDVAPLNGPWHFHLGDDPLWAGINFDDSSWEKLTAAKPWGEQNHPSYTGYAWYRLHLRLDPTHPAGPTNLSLLVPHLDDVYEIYWNGHSIGRSGSFPPYPIWYRATDRPTIYTLHIQPSTSGSNSTPILQGTLAFRLWKAPLLSDDSGLSGGFEGAPVLGFPGPLAAYNTTLDYQWLRSHQLFFSEYLLYALTGLISLFAWLRDRRQRLLLWMTGFTLSPVMRSFLYNMRLAWPVGLSNALGPPLSSIRDISLWFLLLWLLRLDGNPSLIRLTRRFAVLSLFVASGDGLLSLLDASVRWFWLVQIADAILTLVYFLTAALPLLLVAFALRQRHRLDLPRRLLAIAAFLSGMIQVVQGMAPQGSRFTHWTLADKLREPLFLVYGNPISLPTLTSTLLLLAVIYAVYCNSIEDRRRRILLEQEMSSAREIQQFLIPEIIPSVPGFAVTSAYRPALEVGGDFFQIIPLPNDCTLVILGDVSGKGVKAAMAVSLIVGLVRLLVEDIKSPGQLLAELNRQLYGRLQNGFTTCVSLHLDPHGNCSIASAGHPPPYLNSEELAISGSLPLGLFPVVEYEETCVYLQPQDHLALYTDGLLEARSKNGELYGFDRIRELFATRPNAAQATEAAVLFGQDDDITVVTLIRVPIGQESTDLSTVIQTL